MPVIFSWASRESWASSMWTIVRSPAIRAARGIPSDSGTRTTLIASATD